MCVCVHAHVYVIFIKASKEAKHVSFSNICTLKEAIFYLRAFLGTSIELVVLVSLD